LVVWMLEGGSGPCEPIVAVGSDLEGRGGVDGGEGDVFGALIPRNRRSYPCDYRCRLQ